MELGRWCGASCCIASCTVISWGMDYTSPAAANCLSEVWMVLGLVNCVIMLAARVGGLIIGGSLGGFGKCIYLVVLFDTCIF